jgi:hypothetical protein
MEAEFMIEPTDPREIGLWNAPGTPPAPPNISTPEEVASDKNLDA